MWQCVEKTQGHKHCTAGTTRFSLSGCSKHTEHAAPHVLLTRLDSSVFSFAGSVRMRLNSDNLFDHVGIFLSFFLSNYDLFDIGVHIYIYICMYAAVLIMKRAKKHYVCIYIYM